MTIECKTLDKLLTLYLLIYVHTEFHSLTRKHMGSESSCIMNWLLTTLMCVLLVISVYCPPIGRQPVGEKID